MYVCVYVCITICNKGGQFSKDFLEIYPADLEGNVEYNGTHTTFIDVDIFVRMLSITSNLTSIIFYRFTILDFEQTSSVFGK